MMDPCSTYSTSASRGYGSAFARGLVAASLVALALSSVACDSNSQKNTEATEEAKAEEAEVPAVEWTPPYEAAHAKARDAVGLALRDGLSRTIPKVRPRLIEATEARDDARPESFDKQVSILFGANVHGELEDCGCKANPLGGLARRKTLIDLASEPDNLDAVKWWDTPPPADATPFVVDAGDLFYKSTNLDRATPAIQERSKKTASAIVDALNVSPPDVFSVGELDLAFGSDNLQALASNAEFPFISANLASEGGELMFPGHKVVERDGAKVAFIGLTKPKPRIARYYEERGVELKDPRPSYLRELDQLPSDVDLVVLLSNLGLDDSRQLVEGLRHDGKRVDAVIVSNSNRRTRQAVWASGVPMVEPASRGKFFGRLDIGLGGEGGIDYANASDSPVDAFQQYVSAWSSYANARSERERMRAKVAEFQARLEDKENGDGEKAGEPGGKGDPKMTKKALKGRIDYLQKRLNVMETRVERTSETVAKRHANLASLSHYEKPGAGDDWAETEVVDVHIDIPQYGPVKDVVDRWKKKIASN